MGVLLLLQVMYLLSVREIAKRHETEHPKSVKLSQKRSENGSKLFDTDGQ